MRVVNRKIWNRSKPPCGTRMNGSDISQACISFWPMTEVGAGFLNDAKGPNFGSFVNAPTWGVEGDIPTLNFVHASNQGVLVKNGPIIGGLVNWSVFALISTTAPGFNAIYCERAASGNDILKLQYNSTVFGLTYRNDGGTLSTPTGSISINDNNLHLGVITKAGTALKIYTDGKPDGSATFGSGSDAFTDAGIKSQIGLDAGDGTSSLAGSVVYVGVCAVALSPAQISDLWANRFLMLNRTRRTIVKAGAASTVRFRKTLSGIGTRVGTRQTHGAGA